jgi:tetratricopeptide (TPR) repeat protein
MQTDLAKLQRAPREVDRWQKAQQRLLAGQYRSALPAYRALLARFPGVPQLWFELGIGAVADLEFGEAHAAFGRAAQLAPNDSALLILLGQQYHRLRRLGEARAYFERAVAADPASVQARLTLAEWFERERRLDEAWQCVEACLAQHPRDVHARYFRALLLSRKGRNDEAEPALRDLIKEGPNDAGVRPSCRHLLAVVLDAMGRYDEAMRWLLESKAEVRRAANTAALERDYDQADRRRRELLAAMKSETIQRWREESRAAAPSSHRLALLGGHPRSGTTLLEQILGAHPDVRAFDESEAFVQEIWNPLAPMQSAQTLTVQTLDSLSAARRLELRGRYFKSLLREAAGETAAPVLLDKNPSPTASLHLWLRVFPDLKVIIALRDPRDVVLSCLFQNLAVTATNANFLSLERAARHYADLMDVWLRLRELGGFDWIESRYEDVVGNLDGEGRRVTEFLSLSWHPDQARFHENARRKFIFAPTYNEVTRPVHKRAVGRWEHYAAALAPIQTRLAPYCRAFGYEP